MEKSNEKQKKRGQKMRKNTSGFQSKTRKHRIKGKSINKKGFKFNNSPLGLKLVLVLNEWKRE